MCFVFTIVSTVSRRFLYFVSFLLLPYAFLVVSFCGGGKGDRKKGEEGLRRDAGDRAKGQTKKGKGQKKNGKERKNKSKGRIKIVRDGNNLARDIIENMWRDRKH